MTADERDGDRCRAGDRASSSKRRFEPRTALQLQAMALEGAGRLHLGAAWDRDRLQSGGPDGVPLEITVSATPGALLVTLSGDLDYWTGPMLARTIAQSHEAHASVVLDLAQVGFIDGGGIRSLLAVRAEVGAHRFRIGESSRAVRRLLQLVGMDELVARITPAPGPAPLQRWDKAARSGGDEV